tara:strand:- start:1855 stop:2541 length:687 start_codon:yes stop_codon:yes gene_type:complete
MFSIIIPLFNESENIVNLLDEIKNNLNEYANYEIVLVNDCSTDKTLDVIKNIKNNKLKIINNKKNYGQSFSIHTGIVNATYEIIITIDGDGQNDPIDIPKILKNYLTGKDIELIGGVRVKRQDTFIKVISSKIANTIRSKILNDNCSDTGCSLKVFNKKIFLSFPYFDGMHRFLPALFRGYGYKTMFLNVSHRKRKFGISKYGTMNRLFKGIRDLIRVRKIIKNKKYG